MTESQADYQHSEARWLAFTTFVLGNREWHLTLRDGADQALVDTAFETIDFATSLITAYQNQYASVTPADGSQRAPSIPPASNSSRDHRDHVEEICRLEISGTLDAPQVKFISTNTALKFPVLQSRSSNVLRIIEERYGTVSEATRTELERCGNTIPLNPPWTVEWAPSEKLRANGQPYRDVTKIIIPRYEQQG